MRVCPQWSVPNGQCVSVPNGTQWYDRNAFGDAADYFNSSIGGFHDGIGRERGRNENHGRIRGACFYSLLDSVINRKFRARRFLLAVEPTAALRIGNIECRAAFARRDTPGHLRTVAVRV